MTWAHYLLQVNIYLIIFYTFYKILLDKETYFVLNRIYLLAAGILSLSIPFLRFEWFSKQDAAHHIYASVDQLNTLVTEVTIANKEVDLFNWSNIIIIVYLGGIIVTFSKFVFQLFAVYRNLKKSTQGTAFSFFNQKVVSPNLPHVATVNLHEDIHIKQRHTLDILFFEILSIITWFNPIIYAYKATIRNIHEYLADEAAAKFQGDKEMYALLLVSQAFGIKPNILTNGFLNKSLIKKRIYMLHKQRSKKVAILKYGIFLPLFAIALLCSSAGIRKNNEILAAAQKISIENAKALMIKVFDTKRINTNSIMLDTISFDPNLSMAKNEHNENNKHAFNELLTHISMNMTYPEYAQRSNIQGSTIVNFNIKKGIINDINYSNPLGNGCEEEIEKNIKSFASAIEVDGNYSIRVNFKLGNSELKNEIANNTTKYQQIATLTIQGNPFNELSNKETVAKATITTEEKSIISENTELSVSEQVKYASRTTLPSYIGGNAKLIQFINKNLVYPTAALDNDIEGTVKLNFIVEKDGSLTNIKADKKYGYGLEEEAIRVLNLTKKWIPATQNGTAVSVNYSMPIRFAFTQPKKQSKGTIVASIRAKNDVNNAPLYIVDGQLKDNKHLNDLNTNNIDQINVLKSINAVAKYGKKAENGAVVITSKRPDIPKVSATIFK